VTALFRNLSQVLFKLYISSYMVSKRENIETIPCNQSIFELEIRQRLAIALSFSWNNEA